MYYSKLNIKLICIPFILYLTGEVLQMWQVQWEYHRLFVVYKHNPYKNAKYIKVFKMFCTTKIKYIRIFLCLNLICGYLTSCIYAKTKV